MSTFFRKLHKAIVHPDVTIDRLKHYYKIKTSTPKELCDYLYFRAFHRKINWENPEDLNQWIAWLQFNTDTTLWVTLADKYRMRDYVISKGYGDMLVPLLATWESADKIDFANLPEKFVLKCNNGSGDVMIVNDKSKVNIDEVRQYFKVQMERKFGRKTAEPHYLHIKPLIIAEQLLDLNLQFAPSTSLIDYKFWCFNGYVAKIYVCLNRADAHSYVADLYDNTWNNIADGNINYDTCHLKSNQQVPKPLTFDKMFAAASELSKGFPEIRIDFYEVDGKAYIGELTLTSTCGRMNYLTDSCLKEMGKYCNSAVKALLESGQLKCLNSY